MLIDEGFSRWWKKYSAIALFLIGALNSAWAASPDMQALVGPQGLSIANGVLAVLGFMGRFIRQTEAL